jgi:hypothetical protein
LFGSYGEAKDRKIITNTGVEETTLSVLGKTASVQVYEYAYPLAVITTLGMLLMVIATLFFGQLAFSALPDWSAGNYGLLLTSTMASFGTTIVIMLISTAVAIFGLARGLSYRKTHEAA